MWNSIKMDSEHLAIAAQNPLVAAEAFDTHRAARMQLVGRDAHFGAEAVFSTIGKARTRVHHHAAAIHVRNKVVLHACVFGNDCFGMAAAVLFDMVAGFGDVIDELDA